jgi:LmbE family N-acetylglucosaminyl deacetylase
MQISRRSLVASAATLPMMKAFSQSDSGNAPSRHLRVVITGGHPGDPEAGCAGTIARYTALGHDVAILYLNRGEGYCGKLPLSSCGATRTAEAQKACEILKARPVFAPQIDSHAIVDNAHYEEFQKLLEVQNPDVVFTQWPIDKHSDHRAVSMLALNAWLKGGKKFGLYYYEVADDTMMFTPDEYVDISGVEEQRHAACYAHASQSPDKWYPPQVEITRFRGTESGYKQAEAFLRHWESKSGLLPS